MKVASSPGVSLLTQIESHDDLGPAALRRDDLRAGGELGYQGQAKSKPGAVEPRSEAVTVIANPHDQDIAFVLRIHVDLARSGHVPVSVHDRLRHRLAHAYGDRIAG